MAVTLDQLEQLYLAYFGRPADFQGVAFYTSAGSNVTIEDVAATFGNSAESQALYGTNIGPAFVNAIYQNLFGRDADTAGLLFWTARLAHGDITPGGAALAILQGASNADAQDLTMIQNKLAAATAFTNALDTTPEILGYAGNAAAALARAQLQTVTADSATLTAYVGNVDAEVAAVVGTGSTTIGQTVTLTTAVDNVDFSGNATTVDTVRGVVDTSGLTGAFGSGTLNSGDTITGNGKTIVDLALVNGGGILLPGGGGTPFATIKNATVNFTVATSGSVTMDATAWSNISSVNLAAGGGGTKAIDLTVGNLQSTTGLGIAHGVAGTTGSTLDAVFSNGNEAILYANDKASINVAGNLGAVVGTVAASSGFAGFSATAAAGKALSIGDVTIAGNAGVTASNVWLSVYQTNSLGADVSVGNVKLSAADVTLTIDNTSHTSASPAANLSVGNIDVTVAASGSLDKFRVANTSSGKVGNLSVGNVNVTMGTSAISSSSAAFYNNGVGTVGNFSIGTVSAVLATSAAMNHGFHFENNASANSKGAATVGNMSIGGLSETLGTGAYVGEYNVEHYADATGAGSATVGTTNIGSINFSLGQSASMTFSSTWDIHANASGAGNATVGDITIGSVTESLGLNARLNTLEIQGTASVANTIAATTTAAATVGNVTVGDINLTLGIGASVSEMYYSFSATGSAISSVGNVAFGNVTVNGDDGAQLNSLYMHANSSGKVGNVSFGNLSMSGGVSGYLYASGDVTAASSVGTVSIGSVDLTSKANGTVSAEYLVYGAKGVGNVTAGDVTLVGGTNAQEFVLQSFTASDAAKGTVGTVTIGNVSVTGVTNSSTNNVGYELLVAGAKSVGNVAVGNVTVNASGTSTNATWDAYAEFYVDGKAGTGALGTLTIGNVDLTAKGTGMTGAFSATLGFTAATAGTLTVGNVNIDVGAAKATNQDAYVNVHNYHGDAVVGDITINGAKRATGDATTTYSVTVDVTSATGNVKVGNITVVGDSKAADLGNLSFLSLSNGGGTKTTTIGNVDYSGYKGGLTTTIDVQTFKGAGSIVGTAGVDHITDNSGTNSITGGAGADLFSFVSTNKNLTAATVDTITDFNEAQGDRIDVGTGALSATPGSATYGEGSTSYADLAAVITAAKAAEASGVQVFVGQVGTDAYVVVDAGATSGGTASPDFVVKLTGVNYAHIDVSAFV